MHESMNLARITRVGINLMILLALLWGSGVHPAASSEQPPIDPSLTAESASRAANIQLFLPGISLNYNSGSKSNDGQNGDSVMYAMSDSSVVAIEDLEELLLIQKMWACDANLLPEFVELTFDQAVNNSWSYLKSTVGPDNIAVFRAAPEVSTADGAQEFALAAITTTRLDGALAGLLIAQEKAPDDPMMLVNIAAMLNILGMPSEALAFLDQADGMAAEIGSPLGVSGEQVALNNRGHALLALGKWQEAESILRQVVEVEEQLSEARINLSMALLCQDKDDEAMRFFRMGSRRQLWDENVDGPEFGGSLPLEQIFDLSAGTVYDPPALPIATKVANAEALDQIYLQLEQEYGARHEAYIEEYRDLTDQYWSRDPTQNMVTFLRTEDILRTLANADEQPEVKAKLDYVHLLYAELGDLIAFQRHDIDELLEKDIKPLEEKYRQCRQMLTNQFAEWYPRIKEYEAAEREYMMVKYAVQTALAANLVDPLHHAIAMNMIESQMNSTWNTMRGFAFLGTWGFELGWEVCEGQEETSLVETEEHQFEAPDPCPPELKGVRLNLKIHVAGISVNCEVVTVEVSTPTLLGIFVQYSENYRNGDVTVFAGVKVGISMGPFDLSAKDGFYISSNQDGISDVGMKVSSAAGASFGPLSGKVEMSSFEVGIASQTTSGLRNFRN